MEERYIGRLVPGQELCDVNGDKVGTISHVYRQEVALAGDGQAGLDEIVEVKTGFMGLGQKWYVPVSAIAETTDAAAFLDKPAEEFDGQWKERPGYLEQLS